MESIEALSLAVNVLQVVDCAGKLLSTGYEIYQAGTTVELSELDILIKDFTLMNTRLRSCLRPPNTQGPLPEGDQVRVLCTKLSTRSDSFK